MNALKNFGLLLLVAVITEAATEPGTETESEWSYDDQASWPGECQIGKRQSPINIDSYNVVPYIEILNPLIFQNYHRKYNATFQNTGHTVEIMLQSDALQMPSIYGANLPDRYIFSNLHFHWKSEHTIDGRRYPLEMHLVHYSQKYNSVSEALNHTRGITVLGVLFKVSYEDNPALEPMFQVFDQINNDPGKSVQLPVTISLDQFLPTYLNSFYTYEGSLTTPGCNEVVIWDIFRAFSHISERQLQYFYTVRGTHGILNSTYRNLQKQNGRTVTYMTTENWWEW